MILPAIMGATGAWWTPKKITTALWLDAADSDTITLDGSSNVEQWADKSGNSRHATQATSANRPKVDSINGIDAVDFVGTQKALYVPRGFITRDLSIYIVYIYAGDNQRIVDQRSLGSVETIKGWHLKSRNDTEDVFVVADGSNNYRGRADFAPNSVEFVSSLYDEANDVISHYASGVSGATRYLSNGNPPQDIDNTSRDIFIGGNADGSATQDYTGKIGEVILLTRASTTEERQKLEGYLAWKWGLAGNLPAEHPYKSRRPRG